MSAFNPSKIGASASNTGFEGNNNLKAAAMLFLVPRNASWAASVLQGDGAVTTWLQTKLTDVLASRFYPIFGTSAPIRSIGDANEKDIIETLEDGSMQFIRYGKFNRTFVTTEGGVTYAKQLMAFMGNNYAFIEVDILGNVAMMQNGDGSLSGFPVNLAYAPTPELANLKTSYKNQFMLSFSPDDYIKKAIIYDLDATEDVLSLTGLINSEVVTGTGTQTTTNILVKVNTIAGDTDLIALYGDTLVTPDNFVVLDSTGTPVTVSAAAIVGGQVQLTGTFVSGSTYTVSLAPAATLATANVVGYEGIKSASVLIP